LKLLVDENRRRGWRPGTRRLTWSSPRKESFHCRLLCLLLTSLEHSDRKSADQKVVLKIHPVCDITDRECDTAHKFEMGNSRFIRDDTCRWCRNQIKVGKPNVFTAIRMIEDDFQKEALLIGFGIEEGLSKAFNPSSCLVNRTKHFRIFSFDRNDFVQFIFPHRILLSFPVILGINRESTGNAYPSRGRHCE